MAGRSRKLHADWWRSRIARQQEIDKSIAAKAEFEYLYDKPYTDSKKVRVAGEPEQIFRGGLRGFLIELADGCRV